LLQQAPKNPRVLQLAGATELQLGAVGQAQIYLVNALQAAPELALARRPLIVAYLRSGQPAKALAELNAATGKDGVPPALYTLAGEVHLQSGDAKKAEEYFAKALKLDPQDARKRTALAVSHLAGGKADMAIDELQDIAGSDTGTTADLHLISAHLRKNEFAKALAAIDKLEAKQPDKPLAASLRGRVLLAQKDNAGARKSFERALSIDPNYFAAAASLAALDMADKKPDDAKKRFELMLVQNPKNGQALVALAQLAANQGAAKDELAALLGKAIDANPADAVPRLLLIDLYLRNRDNKQALAAAQSAMVAVPNSPELLAALGRAQQVSGDVNQAIATYGKLVALQPLSPLAHVRLAEAYVVGKDPKAAEQSLRKALEIKPDYLDAQRGLIILAIEAKMYPDAIKTARTVQSQRPKMGLGLMLEGEVNVARKDWAAAAAAYKAALQLAPASELAAKLYAATVESGKAKEAEQFAASWMTSHPKDAQFPAFLAAVALGRKDYAAAEKHYLSVLQIQPESALALNNLAWVMGQLHKDGAVDLAEKANKLAPNQPAFMDTLAMLLADRNEFARAIELQNKALALQPENAGLRLNLAKIYIKSGDRTQAKLQLETLAKLEDRFPKKAEVAELLKTL
jgi:putative PEP-CTERM system TPR-repeat lipoprotein